MQLWINLPGRQRPHGRVVKDVHLKTEAYMSLANIPAPRSARLTGAMASNREGTKTGPAEAEVAQDDKPVLLMKLEIRIEIS